MPSSPSEVSACQLLNPNASNDSRYDGFRTLWLKVIIRAIFDYVTYKDHSRLDKRKLAESAHFWLFKPNSNFNSFDSVCTLLGLDADTVRRRARSMTRADVDKLEHLERAGLLEDFEVVHRGGAICFTPLLQERTDDEDE